MCLSVVFECGAERFYLAFRQLILNKSSFHSPAIPGNLIFHLSRELCLLQGKLGGLPAPAYPKGFLVLHTMVSICKRYSRAKLSSQVPNFMVLSAQMALKASQWSAEVLL